MSRIARAVRISTNIAIAGGVVGLYFGSDARSGLHEYVLMPTLRYFLDGEIAHRAAIETMKFPFLNPGLPRNWLQDLDPQSDLKTVLFSKANNPKVKPITLATPIGVAAGLDKNAEAIDSLFQLGFSWVEVGSVTPKPQPGNPKPRVFRLEDDRAIINRYGFNSEGHDVVLGRLLLREAKRNSKTFSDDGKCLAVNLGKNKTGDEVEDYVQGVKTFGLHADALVVNISSPNTPGLRKLQGQEKLTNLLTTLVKERDNLEGESLPPLLVKIAPDLNTEEISGIAEAVAKSKIDGVIVGNTTVTRENLKSPEVLTKEVGGLSGPPVKAKQISVLKALREKIGNDVTVIGCGGISDGQDCIDYKNAGANTCQLYTSYAYRGPGTAALITEDLKEKLAGSKWQ